MAQLPAILAPRPDTPSLEAWLLASHLQQPKLRRKNWTALVQLTWWMLWKERSARICLHISE
jgi:hypothetical protein